jgi:hypothetical protein
MRPWDRDLFQALDQADRLRGYLIPLHRYSGTGPEDPWIEFHVPDSSDIRDLSEPVFLRLSCHYLLTLASDEAIKETMRFLLEKIMLSPQLLATYRGFPGRRRAIGPEVAAVVPRSENPDDDLIIYEEKTDRATVDWILGLSKRR